MSDNKVVDPLEETRAESIRPGKLIAGAPIGGYNLIDVLGEGGMGVVWSAHDPLLDRTIAIKVLKHSDASPQLRLRLLREGRAMARLKHPNVLTVYEVGTEGERDFIAMELVEGGPLDHWLATHPPQHEIMAALLAAGRGLAAAHAVGLVHRDFKPNNVLRSNDGRVMVTDFGLARGLGEDWAAALNASGNVFDQASSNDALGTNTDSVLHSPLTKTGALLGTPAYMAPEQFAGAEPDPRTDQFAFCVTAWQALTGARPFHGRTLDELREAASGGVTTVVADLPKPLRAVLARGLDPDPAQRWPDLDTLLAALEAASRQRARKWPLYIAGAGVLLIVVIAIVLATRGKDASATVTCVPAETAYGEIKPSSDDARITTAFDSLRKRWLATYDQACRPTATKPPLGEVETKLACLDIVRDHAATMTELLATAKPDVVKAFDPSLMLPAPEACTTKQIPFAAYPKDATRDRVLAGLATSLATPEATIDTAGWAPLTAFVELQRGTALARRDVARARKAFEAARTAARNADDRIGALAELALLGLALHELEQPDFPLKKDQPHTEIARHLTYAKAAVGLAGNEPLLAGVLALYEARATADLAERAPKKASLGDALNLAGKARKQFEVIGDARRIADAMTLEAELILQRGDGRALDDAQFSARSAVELLTASHQPVPARLHEILAQIAFARGEFDAAHQHYDSVTHSPPTMAGEQRDGVVLAADGTPVMNATVVVWTGELHGDPRRLVTDRRGLRGEVLETGPDGKFTFHHFPGMGIVAQQGDARSIPATVPATGPITVKLGPTTEATGKVEARPRDLAGVEAFARFSAGDHVWFVHAPIAREGQVFHIGRLPGGRPLFGAQHRAGDATRRVLASSPAKVGWPGGNVVDIVVKGKLDPGATVYLFRHRIKDKTTTRAELDKLAATSTDVSLGPPLPIGSRITEAGMRYYEQGARHALFVIETFDTGGACVAAGPASNAPAACNDLGQDGAVEVVLPDQRP